MSVVLFRSFLYACMLLFQLYDLLRLQIWYVNRTLYCWLCCLGHVFSLFKFLNELGVACMHETSLLILSQLYDLLRLLIWYVYRAFSSYRTTAPLAHSKALDMQIWPHTLGVLFNCSVAIWTVFKSLFSWSLYTVIKYVCYFSLNYMTCSGCRFDI